jgi:uncharacterized protein
MRTRSLIVACMMLVMSGVVWSNETPQSLPFTQNWSNSALLTVTDDWSAVPGIMGYRGDSLTSATGVDPQTITDFADLYIGPVVDINCDIDPLTSTTGGLGECSAIADPVVAFQGSGTADMPSLVAFVNTTGRTAITVACNLRDVDASTDNSIQPVALQYRVGNTGSFTNVASAFTADASTGPSIATLVTPINVVLPGAVDNQPLVQIRWITNNAASNDEWIGVDDISITGTPLAGVSEWPLY